MEIVTTIIWPFWSPTHNNSKKSNLYTNNSKSTACSNKLKRLNLTIYGKKLVFLKSGFRSFFQSKREVVNGGVQTVTLDPREKLRGVVVDAEGQPLANTLVEARGFASSDATGVPATDVAATTDADGTFVLYVDPKISFHLHFAPPASSGAPHFSSLSHTITGSVDGLRFVAPRASMLVGRVLLPPTKERTYQQGATGFSVHAFDTAPISPTQLTAVLRATAVTASSGEYRLLLPSR